MGYATEVFSAARGALCCPRRGGAEVPEDPEGPGHPEHPEHPGGGEARAGATGHGDRKPVPSQAPGQVRSPQVPPRRAAYFAEKGGLLCREGRLK